MSLSAASNPTSTNDTNEGTNLAHLLLAIVSISICEETVLEEDCLEHFGTNA